MPLRKRISLVAAGAVAVAVAIACAVAYLAVRSQLLDQIDGELRAQAGAIETGGFKSLDQSIPTLPASAGGPAPYVQVVLPDGTPFHPYGGFTLPHSEHTAAVAAGTEPAFMTDVEVHGARLRMYTFQALVPIDGQNSIAIQLARPLAVVDNVMSTLRPILALVFFAGIALAAALGRMAARRVLSPLAEMTETAQLIGETDDLSQRLNIHTDDEVGRLAARFNEMLARLEVSRGALDDSVRQQRQLVADASHELRTPVTSMRTNAEVLLAGAGLDDEERQRLLTDVVEQTAELSTLISDLIEVARGDLPSDAIEEVRLDRLVEDALQRARRAAPAVQFTARLHPVVIAGNPERLGRAINNLLDNAARHSGGSQVEVDVDANEVRVRDHGAGISEHDLPHVFERFYRGASSRSLQGSGLGLAIVRQVAEQHDGTIAAANAPDGGAVFTLTLPGLAAAADDDGDLLRHGDGDVTTRVTG